MLSTLVSYLSTQVYAFLMIFSFTSSLYFPLKIFQPPCPTNTHLKDLSCNLFVLAWQYTVQKTLVSAINLEVLLCTFPNSEAWGITRLEMTSPDIKELPGRKIFLPFSGYPKAARDWFGLWFLLMSTTQHRWMRLLFEFPGLMIRFSTR